VPHEVHHHLYKSGWWRRSGLFFYTPRDTIPPAAVVSVLYLLHGFRMTRMLDGGGRANVI